MDKIFDVVGFTVIVSSISYLFITRTYGTPLMDSLTPEQLKIKLLSAGKRRRAYYISMVVAFIMYMSYQKP